MRIVYLMPGAGGSFYCENCLRDAALIRAVARLGHDPLMVPLYLPLKIDEPTSVPAAPVFFGGINVYLEQKSALFRRLPRGLTRWLDAPWLLRWAAKRAGMTRARDLADTTLSMLRGEHGHQARELERLIEWLAAEQKPDVVSLSNCLLIGAARALRERLGVPVVCVLQDEDIFLDGLPEPQRAQAYDAIVERAAHVDAFIAVSHYYAGLMRERLRLPPEKVHVVHNGIPVEGYSPAPDARGGFGPPSNRSDEADESDRSDRSAAVTGAPPVLGFLERLCPEKGVDFLAEAFLALRPKFRGLRLRLAGGWTTADEPFLRGVRHRVAEAGAADAVEFLPNLQRAERQAFLRTLSVLSVPSRHPEAFGMYVIEALAAGVPVALPRRGAFPELVEATGGGVLYDGDGPEPLAAALGALLADPACARALGARGREAVRRDFAVEVTARKTMEVYSALVKR
ncbi:MAG TPA: glycosyltransferase family 4 protein [Planctomycetota bacterium]|nr:glycosyltransferase family 4 protein [Planctomycetota bacterium]HRR81607.1 glycosyltransferase family 4 protein [Planctomycetota bacterium]HRT93080.1 glycosyltransferase family 4 protein [Planctomycetota bacterium]